MLTTRIPAIQQQPQELEKINQASLLFHNYKINECPVNDKILPDYNSNNASVECNNLPNLPMLKLANGLTVVDYTNDSKFVKRLELMPYEEAEQLCKLVMENQDYFPMPCMQITAKILAKGIEDTLRQYQLSPKQIEVFQSLQTELNALHPTYPYKASFILVYKILLCKSVIAYNFHKISLDALMQLSEESFEETVQKYYSYIGDNQASDTDMNIIGIDATSQFKDDCGLLDVMNLPWNAIFDKNLQFENELFQLYKNNFAFEYITAYADGAIISPFTANKVLIPYTGCLTINNLNKIWTLPIWLVGCSIKELTNTDSYDGYSSGFFEHDLFHLRMREYTMQHITDLYASISTWVTRIYANKMFIADVNIKFTAIELAIFWIMHEEAVVGYLGLQQGLLYLSEQPSIILRALPKRYANTSFIEVATAAKFLSYLPLHVTTDDKFRQRILYMMNNLDELNLHINNDCITQEYFNSYTKEPAFIKNIITFVKENHQHIAEMGLTCSYIEANLRIYYKQHATKSNLTFLNIEKFMDVSPFKKEAEWVILHLASKAITVNTTEIA